MGWTGTIQDYLLRRAEEAASTGTPVMRPVAMEFPRDHLPLLVRDGHDPFAP